jgi:hypothetical protein
VSSTFSARASGSASDGDREACHLHAWFPRTADLDWHALNNGGFNIKNTVGNDRVAAPYLMPHYHSGFMAIAETALPDVMLRPAVRGCYAPAIIQSGVCNS